MVVVNTAIVTNISVGRLFSMSSTTLDHIG